MLLLACVICNYSSNNMTFYIRELGDSGQRDLLWGRGILHNIIIHVPMPNNYVTPSLTSSVSPAKRDSLTLICHPSLKRLALSTDIEEDRTEDELRDDEKAPQFEHARTNLHSTTQKDDKFNSLAAKGTTVYDPIVL